MKNLKKYAGGEINMKIETEILEGLLFGLENPGYCTVCDDITHDECEPDAQNYTCPNCNSNSVFGLQEALMMGCLQTE